MADKTKTFSTRIKSKRDTSANWESANPVLLNGEKIIVDTAAGEVREKIGDGVKTYSQLPFTDEKIRGMITEKADEVELEQIKYYGDKDIIPSDESYFVVNSTGETITGLTEAGKTQTELVIPYKINGITITTLYSGFDGINLPPLSIFGNSSPFDGSYNTTITKIVLPNSITNIGTGAFVSSTALVSINIPNSVTSIGDYAFHECTSLKSIDIPDSVTSIGNNAFSGCSSLKTINIPNNVTNIVGSVFSNCTALTEIEISANVTTIGGNAFSGCSSLKTINIPNNVTSIGNNTFRNCNNLTIYCEQGSYAETYAKENNIPVVYTDVSDIATETELERLKYYGDKDIVPSPESYFTVNETGETITGLTDTGKTQTELVIPYKINGVKITTLFSGSDGMSGPPVSILNGNSTITKVVIPKSVTTLGGAAFADCKLNSINIPNSVTSIGAMAFWSCTFLTSINIPNSVTSIEDNAFLGCSSLTSVNIPNSVTSIGSGAFGDCTSLASITIPNSVTSIGSFAFDGCSSNLTIYCEQGSYAETYAKDNNIPVVYTAVNNVASGKVTTITVPTTGWNTSTDSTGETYFTINITNSALTSTGYPLCDVVLPDDIAAARLQDEAYKCIGKITINDGSVTLCCFDEIPSVSFTMRIQIMYL